MSPALNIVAEIALQAVLLALFLGSLFTLAFGVSLMLGHSWVLRVNEATKRWISTREAMRSMDVPRSIEFQLYRWHVVIGLLIAAGAAFILYAALFRYDARAVGALFSVRDALWAGLLLQACWWFGIIAATGSLVVGLLLAARPELLRAVDARANRSYSARRATRPLEQMNFSPDRWISSSPKLSGGIIALCSAYVALVLGTLLLSGV